MSPSVNRSSDSPQSSGEKPSEALSVQNQHQETPTDNSETTTDSATTADSSATTADSTETTPPETQRQQPIPPPSEPMQYRAIGLIRGQYMPSADQLTRGTLLSAEGTLIDSVLLGRVMSLVKNHLDLSQPHLWVVYPRTRQENGNLHVQIVGVWEPDKLNREQKASTELSALEEAPLTQELETSPDISELDGASVANDGYFSIRGQVIYQSREGEEVIVKIKQSPRKESDKMKFFKLKLKGFLGDKVINHFWDFHVWRQGEDLLIQEANDIGLLPMKKRPMKGKGGGYNRRSDGKKSFSNQRPVRKGERPAAATPPKRRDSSVPKPVKRVEKRGGSSNPGNSS